MFISNPRKISGLHPEKTKGLYYTAIPYREVQGFARKSLTPFENDSITDINYPALFSLFLIHK